MRPLKEDTFARFAFFVEHFPDRSRVGQNLSRYIAQLRDECISVDRIDSKAAAQRIMVLQRTIHTRFQGGIVGQIGNADRPAANFVFIGRPDPTPSGADLRAL